MELILAVLLFRAGGLMAHLLIRLGHNLPWKQTQRWKGRIDLDQSKMTRLYALLPRSGCGAVSLF
jgi:hypothetical protein